MAKRYDVALHHQKAEQLLETTSTTGSASIQSRSFFAACFRFFSILLELRQRVVPVPGMIAIVGPAEDIATRSHPVGLAELLSARFLIVVRRAQTGEMLKRWKCLRDQALLLAALGNRDSVVDNFRGRDFPRLQAGFAARMLR
jgi:hypothetical protein